MIISHGNFVLAPKVYGVLVRMRISMKSEETIAAIATAMSNSGIGIIRVSGDHAIPIVNRIYQSKSGSKNLENVESHTIHYGFIMDGEEIIDEVLIMIMKGPHSFTAEDTVEINCHGGVLVMKKILETVIKYGARCAEPGEFTKRAFLNGRIDLSKAEAVIDIINSKNEFALHNSINQMRGNISERISDIRNKILYEIAYIESALDDPEHYDLSDYPSSLRDKIMVLQNDLKRIMENYKDGKILKEGIKTVIVGKPNAGKSSLMNILVGEEKAIVTEIEGTTRDAIEETINLGDISLNIIDTAGIRSTEDIIEKIGVSKAKKYAIDADLIIYVVDSSKDLDENDNEIIDMIQNKNTIVLLNKSDLIMKIEKDEIRARIDKPVIEISAKENQGIDELKSTIVEMFFHNQVRINDEIYITNVRQMESIQNASSSLTMVLDSIENQMPEDFFSIDLMNAYQSLGNVLGEEVGEDLVNEIFSKFCMGK